MSKAILFYDANCPVCRAFHAAIKGYIGDAIEYRPAEIDAKTFRYVGADQTVHLGKDALRRLLADQPAIAPALNLLPEKWKFAVVNAGVAAAGMLRTALASLQKSVKDGKLSGGGGCGCGKK